MRPVTPKARVHLATPSRGECHVAAGVPTYLLATRGDCTVIPGGTTGSLLTLNHNRAWANALNLAWAGAVDYLCLQHSDIEARTCGWLDVMVAEMRRVGAAVLSAVVPLRGPGGLTSTAVETNDPWWPQKLTLEECERLPETFCAADIDGYDGPLLANTGLMLVDLARPEWRLRDPDGGLAFRFTILDRVAEGDDGLLHARVFSEDWNFSRLARRHGLPVYATRAVEVVHHGAAGYSNRREAAGA